ncbi:hypothetical protein N7447_010740 [Penicillium robsamsonii]|uniref:uncharacterized protein n=1 Tax=Penicillium robsamsonii TaxID=1792511 RepID=UPI0025491155|nr:uncharacterized protein N7447_010740 [Penicillium robsamsonii]KAJ5811224.1 hypothetical protein N7447_010740 [Penicillium robsamsonii]
MGSSDNLQPQAIGLIFAFPCFASVAVALRLYSRTLTKSFAADDWVICVAMIMYWAETFTSYKVIIYTYIGYNVWEIPDDHPAILGNKYTYATELIYNPILALVKTSILLFLLRLTGQKKSVRLAIWGLLILNGIAAIITFFLTVFRCVPVAANWDLASYPNANCLNFANFVTGTASASILTDILALMLPTWIVYRLQMQRNQKLMLIGILSLGLLTVVAGIVRLILLDDFDRHMPTNYTHSVLFCVSTIEVGLSFVAACAPSFKPLVTRLVPRLFGSTRTGPYNGSTNRSGRTRLGYKLEETSNFTNRTHDQTITTVEAGDGELSYGPAKLKDNKMITMITEMEVTWGQANSGEQHTSSTESLVYGGGSNIRSK